MTDGPATSTTPATVVWLVEDPGPSELARQALEDWGRARGITLVLPSSAAPRALAVDLHAAEAVEEELARAREALVGMEIDATERSLARAGALLREHPELPQVAWLRAEVERAWSARWLRTGDEARATRAWQRAAALDGGRAPGLGEKAFALAPPVRATLSLRSDEGATLRLDGRGATGGAIRVGEGEHAVAAIAPGGAVLWADWVSLEEGSVVELDAPEAPPCSRADVSRARLRGGAIRGGRVRCTRWVAARVDVDGALLVAGCDGGRCDPWETWRVSAPRPLPASAPAPGESSRPTWPAWATWALAGLAVAGGAVAIAAAAGAFRSPPSETRFVNGGVQIDSF